MVEPLPRRGHALEEVDVQRDPLPDDVAVSNRSGRQPTWPNLFDPALGALERSGDPSRISRGRAMH
jgi:hypothetical protein